MPSIGDVNFVYLIKYITEEYNYNCITYKLVILRLFYYKHIIKTILL